MIIKYLTCHIFGTLALLTLGITLLVSSTILLLSFPRHPSNKSLLTAQQNPKKNMMLYATPEKNMMLYAAPNLNPPPTPLDFPPVDSTLRRSCQPSFVASRFIRSLLFLSPCPSPWWTSSLAALLVQLQKRLPHLPRLSHHAPLYPVLLISPRPSLPLDILCPSSSPSPPPPLRLPLHFHLTAPPPTSSLIIQFPSLHIEARDVYRQIWPIPLEGTFSAPLLRILLEGFSIIFFLLRLQLPSSRRIRETLKLAIHRVQGLHIGTREVYQRIGPRYSVGSFLAPIWRILSMGFLMVLLFFDLPALPRSTTRPNAQIAQLSSQSLHIGARES